MYSDILNKLEQTLAFLVGIIMVVLTIVVAAEVIARYFFSSSFRGAYELAQYLVIWLTFIGSSVGWRRAELISVNFVKDALPPKAAKAVSLLTLFMITAFLVIIFWNGIEVIFKIQNQVSPALRISMSIPYLAIPLGSFFMFLFVLETIIKTVKKDFRIAQTKNDQLKPVI